MEDVERKFEMLYIFTIRLALIVTAVVITMVAITGLALALGVEFTKTFSRVAMWTGSFLWVTVAVGGWVERFRGNKKENPLWIVLISMAIAVGSVAGLYSPTFTTFALWTNTVWFLLLLIMMNGAFREAWKNCATTEPTKN